MASRKNRQYPVKQVHGRWLLIWTSANVWKPLVFCRTCGRRARPFRKGYYWERKLQCSSDECEAMEILAGFKNDPFKREPSPLSTLEDVLRSVRRTVNTKTNLNHWRI